MVSLWLEKTKQISHSLTNVQCVKSVFPLSPLEFKDGATWREGQTALMSAFIITS